MVIFVIFPNKILIKQCLSIQVPPLVMLEATDAERQAEWYASLHGYMGRGVHVHDAMGETLPLGEVEEGETSELFEGPRATVAHDDMPHSQTPSSATRHQSPFSPGIAPPSPPSPPSPPLSPVIPATGPRPQHPDGAHTQTHSQTQTQAQPRSHTQTDAEAFAQVNS
jgi:hypothetical protein